MHVNGIPIELQSLMLQLFDAGAVQFGAFPLKHHEKQPDAPLSPILFNLRTPDNPKPGPLTPEIVRAATLAMSEHARKRPVEYKHISGIPNAGKPYATQLHLMENNPDNPGPKPGLIVLGKTVTDSVRRVDSVITYPDHFSAGDSVLLLDDLITKGDSKLEAIDALTNAGFKIARIIVLIDREQGGIPQLIEAGYDIEAVMTLTFMLNFYVLKGKISAERRAEVLQYIENNK